MLESSKTDLRVFPFFRWRSESRDPDGQDIDNADKHTGVDEKLE
jgi:hypothetical protein